MLDGERSDIPQIAKNQNVLCKITAVIFHFQDIVSVEKNQWKMIDETY